MIARRTVITPDYLLVLLLPIALLSGRFWGFLKDWLSFVALLLSWEAMRGVAPRLGMPVHSGGLRPESWLFDQHLPTVLLQQWIGHGTMGRVVDYSAAIAYLCHFPVTFGVALVLWLDNRQRFFEFAGTLLGTALVAFVFFLLVPTAPPWYSANEGLIPSMRHVLAYTMPSTLSPYFRLLNPNPVAALPSLHAAFAFLAYLAVKKYYPRASWLMLGWCLMVWFSVVYLGEHYLLDVLAGMTLAGLTWLITSTVLAPRLHRQRLISVTEASGPGSMAGR